jgi:hypothetical protein
MISIVPYVEMDGIRTFTDTEIMGFWDQMVADGTAVTTFLDGSVTNRREFLAFMKNSLTILYIVARDGEPGALVWFNSLEARVARIHFCVFQSAWGTAVDPGRWVLDQLITMKGSNGDYLFDTFIGYTAAANRLAVRYSRKLGMKTVGVIPNLVWNQAAGKSEDGVVTYFTRGE